MNLEQIHREGMEHPHGVVQTSLDAFRSIKHKINKNQIEVLGALKELHVATNAEIAQHLGWSINRVTPRCLELRKAGLVKSHARARCSVTGGMATVWTLTIEGQTRRTW